MSNLFNRLAISSLLFLVLTAHAGLLFANQQLAAEPVQSQEHENSEVVVTQLAMNDALTSKENEKPIAKAGPVLLVPMVLAVLALVAVSRRKER